MNHSKFLSLTIVFFTIAAGACAANPTYAQAGQSQTGVNTSKTYGKTLATTIKTGAVSEPTQAEEMQKSEEVFQQKMSDLKTLLDDIGKHVDDLRRQTLRPMQEDLDRVNKDLTLAENELNTIDITKISPLTQLQRTNLQDRIFECRLSMEILNRRWGSDWDVFGLDFFQNASPAESLGNRPVPDNYKIRKGDTLLIVAHSSLGAQDEYSRQVDRNGNVMLPGAGRVAAVGRTTAGLQRVLAGRITSRFQQLTVDITVQSMSPIQVQVAGEAARPGTYMLNGLATVFNALYQAGGPKKTGSLRHISLIRSGHPKRNIDLYDFLLKGNKEEDAILEDGDSIFIYPVGPTMAVSGEVVRPGRYEPDFPMTLGEAIKMAGGAKPGGYLKSVQVERVEKGEYRTLLSETLGTGNGKPTFILQPGDQVVVSTVRQDPTNQVEINGLVGAPGVYGFREGMHISELVKMAQGLSKGKEVYGGRADILRIEMFEGSQIISFDLNKALQNDTKNDVELHKLDRVFIYSPDQVVFQPRLVTLDGCVARPGTYKRTGSMRISDVIAAGGGVLPQAYLRRADLIRHRDSETTSLVRVDLQAALNGDPSANVELEDRDELRVFTQDEVQWQNRTVRIEGAVQRPGEYIRSEGMHVGDLIFIAGGLLPESAKTAEVARCSTSGTSLVTQIKLEQMKPAGDGDMLLMDSDVVTIPAVNPYLRGPEVVYITGEVANPGPYVLTNQNEKLLELIMRAGGLTQHADTNGLLFLRDRATFEKDHQDRDSDAILEKSKMFADKQFLTQLAQMGVKLPENFLLSGNKETDVLTKPVNVQGEQQIKNETVQSNVTNNGADNQKTEDIMHAIAMEKDSNQLSAMGAPISDTAIGGTTEENIEKALVQTIVSARISVSLGNALKDPASPDNMLLRNGDRIFIPRITNVVTVIGAVLHPHSFAAGPNESVDYYIQRSGGYAQDAARKNVVVVRSNGDALPKNAVKYVVPGDTIVIPNTGLVDIAKKWERAGTVTKVLSDVLSSMYVLTKL